LVGWLIGEGQRPEVCHPFVENIWGDEISHTQKIVQKFNTVR